MNLEKIKFYGRAIFNMHVVPRTKVPYLPEYIGIEPTNVCNFKCAFCPQSDPRHHEIVPREYMTRDKCELFLSRIREAGIKTNLIHWTLDGEPFMNKEFSTLISIGAKYGFTNSYFGSNGFLCTADRLLVFPLDRVRINIAIDFCADESYFESVRGMKSSWVVIKKNISRVLEDERLKNVKIDITDISSFSTNDGDEIKKSINHLKSIFGPNERIRYRTRTFHNATGFLKSKKSGIENYHLCPYPWTHFRIASNGDIVPCCRDLQHKTVLGNLTKQSVQEIWNGEQMISLRHNLLKREPHNISACKDCDLPYDDSKFKFKNIYSAALGRLQLFVK